MIPDARPRRWVDLGKIVGLFGIRGALRVVSYTDPRDGILSYPRWWIKVDGRTIDFQVATGHCHRGRVAAQLNQVQNCEQAQKLIGKTIMVPRSALPITDGYYWTDLVGMEVRNLQGVSLGRISGHTETGANDVMILGGGDRERLIPFVFGKYVLDVRLHDCVVVVDWHPDD